MYLQQTFFLFFFEYLQTTKHSHFTDPALIGAGEGRQAAAAEGRHSRRHCTARELAVRSQQHSPARVQAARREKQVSFEKLDVLLFLFFFFKKNNLSLNINKQSYFYL